MSQQLMAMFQSVRARTLQMVAPLEIEDYVVQTAPFMSPPRWHLGHTAWFFEMLLKEYQPGYRIYNEAYLFYFNSYYEKFGSRINKAERGTKSRPTVKETLAYRQHIDNLMGEFIDTLEAHPQAEVIIPLIRLGLEHEMQHQELLVYDIKHLLCDLYQTPQPLTKLSGQHITGMAEIPGGLFLLGDHTSEFSFDNERPAHKVYLVDYAVDRALVSNGDYLAFIEAGGYQDPHWWYAEAWTTVTQQNWVAPLYWEQQDNQWYVRDFFGLHKVIDKANEPVAHVSFYEASAYAQWVGKRLPTEAEWEKAACGQSDNTVNQLFPWGENPPTAHLANMLDDQRWHVSPIGAFPQGASAYGCHQMIGDLWEWTASDYAPYPGFKPYFNEYTDKWFVSQKVLRGGSYGTPRTHIRSTYRNYFYPQERWLLGGFRCAKTL